MTIAVATGWGDSGERPETLAAALPGVLDGRFESGHAERPPAARVRIAPPDC